MLTIKIAYFAIIFSHDVRFLFLVFLDNFYPILLLLKFLIDVLFAIGIFSYQVQSNQIQSFSIKIVACLVKICQQLF